ncbi:MAG TPA: inorganic phosphate transporter, partial [Gemmatimonadaceae bacterium]|nr:inorganic phosphate transporter [Gemmatimonadaceae bacterium]
TIGSGMIIPSVVTADVILAALLGAIIWNLITWYFGLPSSSSHALIGGLAGAGVATAGFQAIAWGPKWIQTLAFIVISPLLGLLAGSSLMIGVLWTFHRARAASVDRFFKGAQLLSSATFSISHGANDAQKTMGIIMGLLTSAQVQPLFMNETGFLRHFHLTSPDHIPFWIKLSAHIAIGLGTLFGGWRIVHTMGSRITKLRPVGGFCAETGGASAILLATHFGIPVSTTHTITGAIVGVGATQRTSAVRWGVAGRIVWAWVLTIPAAATIAMLSYWILQAFPHNW